MYLATNKRYFFYIWPLVNLFMINYSCITTQNCGKSRQPKNYTSPEQCSKIMLPVNINEYKTLSLLWVLKLGYNLKLLKLVYTLLKNMCVNANYTLWNSVKYNFYGWLIKLFFILIGNKIHILILTSQLIKDKLYYRGKKE